MSGQPGRSVGAVIRLHQRQALLIGDDAVDHAPALHAHIRSAMRGQHEERNPIVERDMASLRRRRTARNPDRRTIDAVPHHRLRDRPIWCVSCQDRV